MLKGKEHSARPFGVIIFALTAAAERSQATHVKIREEEEAYAEMLLDFPKAGTKLIHWR